MIKLLKIIFFLYFLLIFECSNEKTNENRSLFDSFLNLDRKNVKILLKRDYVPGNEISSGTLKKEIGDTLLYYQFPNTEDNSKKPIAKFMRIPIQDYDNIRDLFNDYELDTICHSKTELNYVSIVKNMKNGMIFTIKIYHDSTYIEYNVNKKFLYLKYDYLKIN